MGRNPSLSNGSDHLSGNADTEKASVVQEDTSPIDKKALDLLCKKVGEDIQVFHVPEDPSDGIWSLFLPKSIYSTVFMLPVTVSMRSLRDKDSFISIIITQVVLYITVISVQGAFMINMYRIIGEQRKENTELCAEGDQILRVLCLAANVSFIFGDILETVNMYRWLNCVPAWNRKIHKKILNFCRKRQTDASSFPMQRYKNSAGLEVRKPAVGFTIMYRMVIIVMVLLPKLILGLWLLIYGTGFVASADNNSDLILNSVALLFIIQLDDVSYNLLTPDAHKSWLLHSFEITFFKEEENKIMRWLPFVCFWAILTCVATFYYTWCKLDNTPLYFFEWDGKQPW